MESGSAVRRRYARGGASDIGKGLDDETALSARKLASGAEFLICQPSFDAQRALRFRTELANAIGDDPLRPIFAGVQIPMAGGVDFGNVPDRIRKDLEAGRSGMDIAKEVAAGLWNSGVRTFLRRASDIQVWQARLR